MQSNSPGDFWLEGPSEIAMSDLSLDNDGGDKHGGYDDSILDHHLLWADIPVISDHIIRQSHHRQYSPTSIEKECLDTNSDFANDESEDSCTRKRESRPILSSSGSTLPKPAMMKRRVKSLPTPGHSRRWGSCPSQLQRCVSEDERKLRHRRLLCESSVRNLYEERKDHILEIFSDTWLLSNSLEDDFL